jgi:hypothetical protein
MEVHNLNLRLTLSGRHSASRESSPGVGARPVATTTGLEVDLLVRRPKPAGVGRSQSHADGATCHGVASALPAAIVGQAVGSASRDSSKVRIRVEHHSRRPRRGCTRPRALRGGPQSRHGQSAGDTFSLTCHRFQCPTPRGLGFSSCHQSAAPVILNSRSEPRRLSMPRFIGFVSQFAYSGQRLFIFTTIISDHGMI